MHFKRKKRIVAPPDITPMIDVVFLLLIFFMLSTTFIVHPGITIDLPQSSAEQLKKEKEELEISITKEGEIYFEDRVVSIETLGQIFSKSSRETRESTVIINADEKTDHGAVVQVMDTAKTSGITRLAISTEPKK